MVTNKKNGVATRPRGRPVGSKNKSNPNFDSAVLIKNSIKEAMVECERRGRPLHILLADEMAAGNPSRTLGNLSKFLPNEVNLNVTNSFSDALTELNARIMEETQIIEHDEDD